MVPLVTEKIAVGDERGVVGEEGADATVVAGLMMLDALAGHHVAERQQKRVVVEVPPVVEPVHLRDEIAELLDRGIGDVELIRRVRERGQIDRNALEVTQVPRS